MWHVTNLRRYGPKGTYHKHTAQDMKANFKEESVRGTSPGGDLLLVLYMYYFNIIMFYLVF